MSSKNQQLNYELVLAVTICKLVIANGHIIAAELLLCATSTFSSFSLFFSIDGGLAQLKKYLMLQTSQTSVNLEDIVYSNTFSFKNARKLALKALSIIQKI